MKIPKIIIDADICIKIGWIEKNSVNRDDNSYDY